MALVLLKPHLFPNCRLFQAWSNTSEVLGYLLLVLRRAINVSNATVSQNIVEFLHQRAAHHRQDFPKPRRNNGTINLGPRPEVTNPIEWFKLLFPMTTP